MKKTIAIIVTICIILTFAAATYRYTNTQMKVHEIADMAREIGLPEDNPIIREASRIWWEEEGIRTSAASETQGDASANHHKSLEGIYYNDFDTVAVMLAKVVYGESRGIYSITEQACIIWTVLNRVDHGYGTIEAVVTAPNQFCYRSNAPTVDDYGRDLVVLAKDVLTRWEREHAGEKDVGRVLPLKYMYYGGNGRHNSFRSDYYSFSDIWDYSLPSPYES